VTSDSDADPVDVTIATYSSETARYIATCGPPSHGICDYLDSLAAHVPGGHILELGTGPGWDSDYLEAKGLTVDRTDATPQFVERLRALGHDARILDARSADYGGPYDGVLADAVLLHLTRPQLEHALGAARRATRDGGILAITLKEGDGEAWSTAKLGRPRYFTYWRAEEITAVLERTKWQAIAIDHFSGRVEPWLFVLARAGADEG
jgi:SAM-dependent methyltransferase